MKGEEKQRGGGGGLEVTVGNVVREKAYFHAPSAKMDRSLLSHSQYTPHRWLPARKGIQEARHLEKYSCRGW